MEKGGAKAPPFSISTSPFSKGGLRGIMISDALPRKYISRQNTL
jgi:hypothetical protein